MDKKRPLVGIIVAEADRSFLRRVMYHLQKTLLDADVDVAVFSPPFLCGMNEKFIEAEGSIFDVMNLELIDGLIIYSHTIDSVPSHEALFKKIAESFKKPVICLESPTEGYPYEPFIDSGGAYQIIEHLVKCHGVKTIDFVGGSDPADADSYLNRLTNNFIGAMCDFGYDIPQSRIHAGDNWIGKGDEITEEILANPDGMPDAIVCSSDATACSVIAALESRGVTVPDDVIVVGYGKNEPYNNPNCNITSVIRSPKNMAVNTANRLLAMMGIRECEIVSGKDCCVLSEGSTCGCVKTKLSDYAKQTMLTSLSEGISGFSSQYNFMTEDLMDAADYEQFLWVLDWYVSYLGETDGFWLCLNDNVIHETVLSSGFTEKMNLPYQKIGKQGSVDLTRSFDRSLMLPAIFEERDHPAAFIFTTLHFLGENYGYAALSYGESCDVYGPHYSMWLRRLVNTLQMHRKHFIYEDTVKDAQIRDSLTGLFNMRGYTRIMTERGGKFDDPDKVLRIISIDVENLRNINDSFGYAEGDKLLISLALQMMSCVGDNDICVRVNGDEFFFASIVSSDSAVDDLTCRLLQRLEAFNSSNGRAYGINIYTACVFAPLTSKDVIEKLPYEASYQRGLIKDSHDKLHKTVSADDDFDPQERENVVKLLNGNLFTYQFQPIINAKNGEIFAYEALMRSGSKVKISPLAILKHAEALERLYDVEKYTMFNLFETLEKNIHLFDDKLLFINSIPAYILSEGDFESLRKRYGDIMNRAVIEFTEQTEANEKQLDSFRRRSDMTGFKVAIDDYGTGYSNISNLLNYCPNFVKIDRSLIMKIHKDKRKQHFVKNIIDYAHDNGFLALAEGVELYDELQTSIELGADLIQGFYTAKPSDDFIPEIDESIREEIIRIGIQADGCRNRKTYITGKETELAVMALALDGYTDILVTQNDLTLLGNAAFVAELAIRVKDNLDCHITLSNLSLANDVGAPCITVGENSSLTLEIQGNVSVTGSICVPEKSSIDIVGDGSLTMNSSANQSYGIGCDPKRSFGNIGIHLNNLLSIKLDSYQNVAIGGGFNNNRSEINVCASQIKIEQTGKFTLGIGCFYSKPIIHIDDSTVEINERVSSCIGIGSYNESIEMYMKNSVFRTDCSGNKLCGIGAYCTKGSNISINACQLVLRFNGKCSMCIGSEDGAFDIVAYDSVFDAICEGAEVVTIGSFSKKCSVSLYRCTGNIKVKSDNGMIYGVSDNGLFLDGCSIDSLVN